MNKKITLSDPTAKQTNNKETHMLKKHKSHNLINFQANIIMCKEHQTAGDLKYWKLQLFSQGKLIDAFQWQTLNKPMIKYIESDSILVYGKWTSEHKERFQIINSEIVTRTSANDDVFSNKPCQLEFDFGDARKQQG